MKNKANQIVIFLLAIVLFTSCSKDKDDSVSPAIVGKWKDMGAKGSFTVELLGQKETENLDEPATGEILEFKADGTVAGEINGGVVNKYKTSGSKLTFTILDDGKSYDFSFNYSVSGSKLILKMDKALFSENINNIAKVLPDSEFGEFKEVLLLITAFDQTTTFEKVP